VVLAGALDSSFATVSHNLHRLRRAALNPFFSKRAISAIEPLITSKIELLCRRFEDAIKTKEVIRLDAAYMALTMDIITHYSYGQSYNHLAEDDFKLSWKESIVSASANGAFLRQFPWALPILEAIPFSILQKINPQASALVEWQQMVQRQVDSIILANQEGKRTEGTIFQALLDSDLPPQEKSADRLRDEGQTLVGAGSETTAKALSFITFYLLQDKNKLQRLRKELHSVMPTPNSQASLATLEQLPYLVGLAHLRSLSNARLTLGCRPQL
jgi:cytochrome P450